MFGVSDFTDEHILRLLEFSESRLTEEGLKNNTAYRRLLREAHNRKLRKMKLTEEEALAELELYGPGLDRI